LASAEPSDAEIVVRNARSRFASMSIGSSEHDEASSSAATTTLARRGLMTLREPL
jgi:hypothetical protein